MSFPPDLTRGCNTVTRLCKIIYNELDNFESGTNVAVHKPANQSTTARGGSAGNANDGDPTTVHDGRRCTETLKEPSPWWSVDLLQPYPVRAVSITTRGCCGKYFTQQRA